MSENDDAPDDYSNDTYTDLSIEADVEIGADAWASIAENARKMHECSDKSPGVAFWDAVYDHVEVVPNIVVDGEAKGPEDVDGVPHPDEVPENPDAERLEEASTGAYVAVGLLDGAIRPDAYHARDVEEAVEHLEEAADAAPEGTDAAEHIRDALEVLDGVDELPLDERRVKVHDALAHLAPVAAGVSDVATSADTPTAPPTDGEKPTVPGFYNVPASAANRGIARFKRRRERMEAGLTGRAIPTRATLAEYILGEVDEQTVLYVDGEPFGEYASGRVESLVIDPTSED